MGIFRVKKDNNYSVINNTGLKDKRLSWKAKGILAYILTLPDDWVFYRE
ncbi:DNA-binding protein, partial [Bacillus wiedmannii]